MIFAHFLSVDFLSVVAILISVVVQLVRLVLYSCTLDFMLLSVILFWFCSVMLRSVVVYSNAGCYVFAVCV